MLVARSKAPIELAEPRRTSRAVVGHALLSASATAYPRRGQAIVSRRLFALLADALPVDAFDAQIWTRCARGGCRTIALRAIEELRRAIKRMPDELTSLPLPDPSTLLATVLLDTRTRNVLMRSVPPGARGVWTLGRYLAIPGFNARCCLDALASLEDPPADAPPAAVTAPPAGSATGALDEALARIEALRKKNRRRRLVPAPPLLVPEQSADARCLEDAMARIAVELPLSEAALGARLTAEGIASRPVTLARLTAAAARVGLQPPFVMLTQGGARIAVRRRDVPLATGAYAIAVRTIYNWGMTTAASVASQLSAVSAVEVAPTFVARTLSAARGFEWLQESTGWFWLRGRPSRLMESLAKIFSVVTRLGSSRLYQALFKAHDPALRPPPSVVERLGLALPEARIEGDAIAIRRRLDRSIYLSAEERPLVEALEAKGETLSIRALRTVDAFRSLSSRAILRIVRLSPLIELLPSGRCCLVGAPFDESGQTTSG